MRTAHLIITYTNPKQTERMIRAMAHPDFDFYIHVDKKVDISSHLYLGDLENVFFIQDRVDVRWAGFNTVKAEFNGIREICETGKQYNFINLLSGQDYPLKSAVDLASFFGENSHSEFISYVDYEEEAEKKGQWHLKWRYSRYHLSHFTNKALLARKTRAGIECLINGLTPVRKVPYGYRIYGKSMFWMLSPQAALYVVNTVENDTRLRRFFQFTWACDEFLFQTMLMNSSFRSKVVNNNCRYIDWLEGGSHPKILGVEDFDNLKSSDMLFGRKFDLLKDPAIFDMIDLNIL